MTRSKGFTLVELMIVVVIVGVLAAVAIPAYSSFILKSHRTEAINSLLDTASRQARYYTTNNTYTGSMTSLGFAADPNPVPSATTTYFNVSVAATPAATASAPASFTLQAVPTGTQANDSCGTFTYTDLGQKGVSAGTVASCWGQ